MIKKTQKFTLVKAEINSLFILCVIGRGQPMLAGGSGGGKGMEPKKSGNKKGGPLGNNLLLQNNFHYIYT